MRPADFHNVLHGVFGENQLQILEETTKRFPYFSGAQVLLAQKYWQEDHLDKQLQLEQASLRVADRTYLYHLLHNKMEVVAVKQISEPEIVAVEEVETTIIHPGLPDELIPDLHVYDISMAPDLVTEAVEEVQEDEEFDFVGWLKALETDKVVPIRSRDNIGSALELIDQFIEKDPQISKRDAVRFYSPQEMGRKSVSDDFGFVSETLAQIYEDQGDTEKAIKAYRSLQLRFPEKSSYFAARLKKLET
jgi:tetratricopeptide (TPR) repeat protein